jgi:hypothetical protein
MRTLLLLLIALSAAQPARACSFQKVEIARDTAPYFVFEASPDTVPAPAWVADESRPPRTLSTFGQVARITRLAADADPDVRAALRHSGGRAVLVPWSVSADCRTEGWAVSSYRWITSSEPAFLSARLRPRSAWASGIPTFDVHAAYLQPFPHEPSLGAPRVRSAPEDRSQVLTAEEYFALQTFEEWESAPGESRARLEHWLRTHPRLAAKYPANTLIEEAEEHRRIAEWQAELERLRSIAPPLAGTYRLEVAVNDGQPRTFFVRTRSRATNEWVVRPTAAPLASAERVRERDGYTVLSSGSMNPAELPETCDRDRRMEREGYLSLLETPEAVDDGTRLWRGKIGLDLVARQFPADTTLKELARLGFERFAERTRAGLPVETPAVFLERPEGSVQVRQSVTFQDGRTVTIRGERTSTTRIECTW